MPPQPSIPPAATVLGTIGTVLWCVQLVPQVWRNHRTKSTEGLPAAMMFLWACCGVPFGAYAVVQGFNVPIQVQPQVFCALCLTSWAQCLRYGRKWRVWTTTLLATTIALFFAGMEVFLILIIRGPYHRGVSWPVTLVGVVAAVLLIIGFVPVPFELWKRRGRVVGIDFVFLTIDWFGSFFSLMALVAQYTFDILGGVLYAACAAIEASIFLSQIVWLFRTQKIRRRAKEAGLEWDEFPEAQAWQEGGWPLPWNRRKSYVGTAKETTGDGAAGDKRVSIEELQKKLDHNVDIEQYKQV